MSELKAIVRSISTNHYTVQFYYQKPGGGRDVTLPCWDLPCRNYEHACAVCDAFNRGGE